MSAPSTSRRTSAGSGRGKRQSTSALRSFVRAPLAVKAMALEAALLLLLARLLIMHVPMRYWRRRLTTADPPAPAEGRTVDMRVAFSPGETEASASAGERPPQSPVPEASARETSAGAAQRIASAGCVSGRRLSRRVARIVRKIASHPPFKAVCLPQAMAAQWMLRRRGMESRLSFGARRKGEGRDLEFHAWLNAGGECVLGGDEIETYAALPPFDDVIGTSSDRPARGAPEGFATAPLTETTGGAVSEAASGAEERT